MMFIRLLYGSGLRLMECLRLRVKTCPELGEGDLDFAQHQILVRDGKGEKDRVTMLPESLVSPLQDYLRIVKRTHEEDLAKGYGAVYLPYALERQYLNAEREWIWQHLHLRRRYKCTSSLPIGFQ